MDLLEKTDENEESELNAPPVGDTEAEPVSDQNSNSRNPGALLKSAYPIILLVIMVSAYLLFDHYFIKCIDNSGCHELESKLISQVDQPMKLSDATNIIENKDARFKEKLGNIQEQEKEIAETQKKIVDNLKEQANQTNANVNSNVKSFIDANLKLTTNITAQKENLKKLTSEKDTVKGELLADRKQLSARYSNRLLWVFMTAFFMFVCAAAIGFSVYVILAAPLNSSNSSESSQNNVAYFKFGKFLWLLIVALGAIGFAVVAFRQGSDYMAIVSPLFKQSIDTYGDLKTNTVNLFHVIGFASIIFLVGASCSILYSVETVKQSGKTVLEKSLEYARNRSFIRTVLYIGSALLFVGMFRVSVLSDLHLAFVTGGKTDVFGMLLNDFFKTSLTVQAGFYAILLGVIYLPVANRIPESDEVVKTLDENGYIALIQKFAPRFIMLLSPFLAKPVADMFSGVFSSFS